MAAMRTMMPTSTAAPRRAPLKGVNNLDMSTHSVLQRGFACLTCRKRKLRCDSVRPSCGACAKVNRGAACTYDDGRTRTRTQMLQDKIKELEEAVASYQASGAIPSTSYSNGAGLSSSSTGFPDIVSPWSQAMSLGSSPNLLSPTFPGFDLDLPVDHASPPSTGSRNSNPPIPPDWDSDLLPAGLTQQLLVDTFLSHRHQLYFDVHTERFRALFGLPRADSRRPHPCLINAVYLIACQLTPVFTHHADYFLTRARLALAHALEQADKLFNYIQASGLITMYLLGQGRVLEAYYLMGATSRFAVGSGLHQIASPVWTELVPLSPVTGFLSTQPQIDSAPMLDHPVDSVELGERIAGWWQVWAIDRIGSIYTALPGALTDDADPATRIDTCWPRSIHDFIHGAVSDAEYATIRSLYDIGLAPTLTRPDSISTLRMKAIELYSRAGRVASGGAVQDPNFWQSIRIIDRALATFSQTLPYMRNTGNMGEINAVEGAPINMYLIMPHTLALATTILIHWPLAPGHESSYQKSLFAAQEIMDIVHSIVDCDFSFLELVLGNCWAVDAAEVLLGESARLRRSADLRASAAMDREVDTLAQALRCLRQIYPILKFKVDRLDLIRAQAI